MQIVSKQLYIQFYIKLGGFISALQYLDGEIVCWNSVNRLIFSRIVLKQEKMETLMKNIKTSSQS